MSAGNGFIGPNSSPPRRVIPAWMLSFALHASLLVILLLTIRMTPRGAEVQPDRSAGIVLASRTVDHVEYFDESAEFDVERTDADESNSSELPLPSDDVFQTTVADELPATGGPEVLHTAPGGLLPNATDFTAGRPPSKRFGRSVQTSVFGLSGVGSQFVYVFDRSGSMGEFNGRPLAAAKKELLASLDELEDVHQFQVIFYNDQPAVFNPTGQSPHMWWADDRGKTLARRFVASMAAAGGTEHMAALQMALGMKPHILFFLTDANEPQLSLQELDKIRRQNSSATAIHIIEFGYGPASKRDNFLKRLARQNGGRHAYVDISRLRGAKL